MPLGAQLNFQSKLFRGSPHIQIDMIKMFKTQQQSEQRVPAPPLYKIITARKMGWWGTVKIKSYQCCLCFQVFPHVLYYIKYDVKRDSIKNKIHNTIFTKI